MYMTYKAKLKLMIQEIKTKIVSIFWYDYDHFSKQNTKFGRIINFLKNHKYSTNIDIGYMAPRLCLNLGHITLRLTLDLSHVAPS